MKQKTKKIILLISTTLCLLITLGFIFAISFGLIDLKSAQNTSQISYTMQFAFIIICAIANIISIILISKDLILHKKKIISLNIINLLLGTIFDVFFAVFNITLLLTKTPDVKEPLKEKEKLPFLEDITKYKWYVYFIIFILIFAICYTPLVNILPITQNKVTYIITMITLYLIQIVGLVTPMFEEIKRDFVVFKNNFKIYIKNMLPRFGIIVAVYFIASFLTIIFAGTIPNNQANLLRLPIYLMAFLAIVIGPLTEELMFRGFIRKFIKNDILFVILSSLIFGGLHVLSADSLQQLLFIIPYSILGFAFSLNYVKTKNIVSNIFLHSVWNTLAVLLVLFAI